ncbi:helix-turn-helix domain-containing protein [Chryseolinea soli]|uniref:AraC family transcriptional regulator n=1 Tax=Chryseolinea soli TaxID=2321403 RepID=A0A385SPS5_9BACT|nr:AraC family transcriptional regulator [Chryseolinea soli]AYB33004.1 AraC family transcriptional regulator [Chryseolinea soli]
MTITENMLLFVVSAGIVQAFFLAALIFFNPRGDRSVNIYLVGYIVSLTIPMFAPLILHFYSWQRVLYLAPVLLLVAPFLYLYVCSFREQITFRKAWPHFILFLVAVVIEAYIVVKIAPLYPPSKQVPPEVIHSPWPMTRVILRLIQMLTYIYFAGRSLSSYQRSIQQLYSETSRIDLAWMRWLINGFLVLTIWMIFLYAMILKFPEQFRLIILINTAVITPYLYAVTFKGISQPTLWQARPKASREEVLEEIHLVEETEARNQKNTLNPERKDDIVARIQGLMEQDKLYLQAELTLQDLADQLGIPAYQVSQAINEGLQKTFYDLVNGCRVAEAQRLLLDPKNRNLKIMAVAFDSGFNSKTTFNTVFKKFTGLTPSEFKEQHQAQTVAA